MEEAEMFLAPFDGHVTLTRNGTELSRFCERLVVAFLGYGASCARVRSEMAPFGADKLYEGLRNVCGKKVYRGSVAVHKQDGCLVLVRKRRTGAERA